MAMVGLVAAVSVPSPGSAFSGLALASLESGRSESAGAMITAPSAAAPERPGSFGVIGFTAQAKPKPKPEPEPTETKAESAEPRVDRGASRSVSFQRRGVAYENGLSPNAIAVANAVRAEFGTTNIGGYRAGDPGDHGSGHAVDIMCSTSQGDAIAAYLQSRAGELGIKYLIWKQRRWAPGGSWVFMADRGSATANHYDHVHVSVR